MDDFLQVFKQPSPGPILEATSNLKVLAIKRAKTDHLELRILAQLYDLVLIYELYIYIFVYTLIDVGLELLWPLHGFGVDMLIRDGDGEEVPYLYDQVRLELLDYRSCDVCA